MDNTKDYEKLNDPDNHPDGPYLLYDENGETIISRTAKGINRGDVNPFEINMMEVTLYETIFVRQLLECIDSEYLMDVADAIDTEDERHYSEDGHITYISSDYYGTGQRQPSFYFFYRDSWDDSSSLVESKKIAENILARRQRAE